MTRSENRTSGLRGPEFRRSLLGDTRGRLARHLLLGVVVLVTTLSFAFPPSDASPSAAQRLTDRLELTTTSVIGGQQIKGWLVVENRGNAINLTKVATRTIHRRGRTPSTQLAGCRPDVGVGISNSHYRQSINFLAQCSPKPFVIRHGVTRIPVTIFATYSGCTQPGGTVTATNPACLSTGPSPMPPLATGRYKTQVAWSEIVPIPTPKPLTVTVRAAA